MSNDKVVINVESLSKRYFVGHESVRRDTLRDMVVHYAKNFGRKALDMARGYQIIEGDEVEEFWALKDVSFKVECGEVIGIIGRNGAGKSTLLKILSRITEPTHGRVTINGRVASLLDVGTGFHPELTGRENVFLNGAVLGMSKAEVRRKFDEIVAFAEVERFLDTPVKRYSSGMYVRLAFAVAAHLEPEILIVDEVLAVGDAQFQKKCLGKMSEVAGGGRTVLFVSHNTSAIQTLCSRAIFLVSGSLVSVGPTDDVVSLYFDQHTAPSNNDRHTTKVQQGLELERVGITPSTVSTGETIDFDFVFRSAGRVEIRECVVLIYSAKGVRVAALDVRESRVLPFSLKDSSFTIRSRIVALPLIGGRYTVGLYLVTDGFAGNLLDLADFSISAERPSSGFIPYPPEVCGLVALKAEARIVADSEE
jgi:lipopolysaccharide transport system ATP-binding protein